MSPEPGDTSVCAILDTEGKTMKNKVSSVFFAGLGLAAFTKEKAEDLVRDLVAKGERTGADASSFLGELLRKGEKTIQK